MYVIGSGQLRGKGDGFRFPEGYIGMKAWMNDQADTRGRGRGRECIVRMRVNQKGGEGERREQRSDGKGGDKEKGKKVRKQAPDPNVHDFRISTKVQNQL